MADWCSHAARPEGAVLRQAFREAVSRVLGWRLDDSVLTPLETRARDEALAAQSDPGLTSGRRLVADGVKLNASMSLVERATPAGRPLCLVQDGRIVRQQSVAT